MAELGIGQVLSIGEPVIWDYKTKKEWPAENLLYVDKVQDNGVDPLTDEFARCLEFIGKSQHNTIILLRETNTDANIFSQRAGAEKAQRPWCTVE